MSCKTCTISTRCFGCDITVDYSQENAFLSEILNPEEVFRGVTCLVKQGENILKAKIVSKNKQKKTCFVKLFSHHGLEAKKTLFKLSDIRKIIE